MTISCNCEERVETKRACQYACKPLPKIRSVFARGADGENCSARAEAALRVFYSISDVGLLDAFN